jgi:hypothetical protein
VQIKGTGQSEGDWGVWFVNGAHDIVVRHLRVRMGGNMKHDAGNNMLCCSIAAGRHGCRLQPVAWEIAHGLDPNNARDGAAFAADGYTHVENYLNELAGDPVPGL